MKTLIILLQENSCFSHAKKVKFNALRALPLSYNLIIDNLAETIDLHLVIIMVIFKCYFYGEHIALSINKNNNGVNIAFGETSRLRALGMMQINT